MMSKNRKIIALICAISMIFTMFGVFTVNAGAEDIAKGIVLEYDEDASTKTSIVLNAKYVGFESGISSYQINFNVPEGVTVDKVKVEPTFQGWFTSSNLDNGIFYCGGAGMDNTQSDGGVIAKITITLDAELPSNFTMKLQEGSTVADMSGELSLDDNTLPVATVKVPADPDAPIVEPLPKPSTNPDVNLPAAKDPVDVTKGIIIEYDKDASTDTSIVLNAKYVGFESGISSYQINFNVPEGVTVDQVKVEPTFQGWFTSSNLDSGIFYCGGAGMDNTQSDGGVIAKITITLPSAIAADYIAELQEGSTVADMSGELSLDDGTLPAAWTKVPAGEQESLDNSIPLIKDGDGEGLVGAPSGTLSENAYAALEVKKADGSPATYGEDYVAYYKGEKLTKEQLDNILAGMYCDESTSLVDILKDVVLEYNDRITGTLQIVDNDEVIADGETPTTGPTPSTPTPGPSSTKGKVDISQSDLTVRAGNVVKVNPTVKVGKDTIKNVTFRFAYEKDLVLDENGEPSAKDKKTYDDNVTADKKKYDFVGAFEPAVENTSIVGREKTTTKKDFYIYLSEETQEYLLATYEDLKDTDVSTPKKVNITVTAAVTGGSGGSSGSRYDDDDDDGNGPIAGPGTVGDGTTNPYVPSLGDSYYYIDIDATPWAVEAINGLTAKGMLAGYGDKIFKPNNNVTRAEFATMITKVFNIPASTGGQQFLDVAPVDWFYAPVQACAAAGIVSGYGNGYYDPNKTIARQEMAVMVYRAARNCGKSDYLKPIVAERVFVDEYAIADYAKEAVKVLQMAGIISGMSQTEYCPLDKATRAQSAVMLYPFSK